MNPTASSAAVRYGLDAAGVATIWFDVPGRPVNTLSAEVWDGLAAALDRIEADRPVGVVLASAKPRSFVVGADLGELKAMSDAALDAHLARGQRILDRLEALPVSTVAAINGDALGGGWELAIACRQRVAADEPRARLGMPETTLGLVPAWGGTLRLPRLVGLEPALELLVPGRTLTPAEAVARGLVDRLVPPSELSAEAMRLAVAPPPPAPARIELHPAVRREICGRFRAAIRDRSGDDLPAPLRLVDLVESGLAESRAAAAAAERRGLLDVRATPAARNLVRLFFLRSAARKQAAAEAAGTPRPVRSAAVIGGGPTAGSMAAALAGAGVTVHVMDPADSAAAADSSLVAAADLVVEAGAENLPATVEAFRRIDALARPDAVRATTTAACSVAALAAVARDPALVIGLHLPEPLATTPLMEVVRSPTSSADALATGVAVATACGKTPFVCRDVPGLLVNRLLFAYLRAAVVAVAEGADAESVDAALRAWGMATGPCALLDEIGLDVCLHALESFAERLGPRFAPPPLVADPVTRGWRGRATGRGLCEHPPAGGPIADAGRPDAGRPDARGPDARRSAGSNVAAREADAIVRRLVGVLADEARAVLAEGVVASADAIDLATVAGLGFPAFRGGLATYAGLG